MKIKYLSFLIAIVLLMCAFVVNASAEAIDLDKKGSVSITVKSDGESVTSGSFEIFQIATLKWNIENYEFVYTEQFSDCGIGFDRLDSNSTADNYANFVKNSSIEGKKQDINEYGIAVFTDLPVGLYLVVQNVNSEGYAPSKPFIVTLPANGDDGWIYEISATPKLDIQLVPINPPTNIPQTGQLKWPIPVLAVSGIVLFSLGWILWSPKRKNSR